MERFAAEESPSRLKFVNLERNQILLQILLQMLIQIHVNVLFVNFTGMIGK